MSRGSLYPWGLDLGRVTRPSQTACNVGACALSSRHSDPRSSGATCTFSGGITRPSLLHRNSGSALSLHHCRLLAPPGTYPPMMPRKPPLALHAFGHTPPATAFRVARVTRPSHLGRTTQPFPLHPAALQGPGRSLEQKWAPKNGRSKLPTFR